jgi:alpha-amylase
MTGESWDYGVGDSEYFDNGFDSMINFTFPNKAGNTDSVGATWQGYADAINSDPTWNVLTYISSHDTALYAIGNKINAGTCLVLCPGGVQIFYGDENDRPLGPVCSDPAQRTRSDYVWNANPNVLVHWQKLGRFRNMHPAVGAGSQISLGNDTYGRIWNDDKIVIKINGSGSTEVSVNGIFNDGASVRNAYNGETGIVNGGKVTFTAENGVILIEQI